MTKLTGNLGVRNEINVDIIGTGARGKEGKSAYELWLIEGNVGTIEDYFESLKGKMETYVHSQIASSVEWKIEHSLKRYPSVTVVDTGGNVVVGSVQYIDKNNIIIFFTCEFSGTVYLN